MSDTQPIGRQALKRLTKKTIEEAYREAGCYTETKSAGAVTYVAVRLSEDNPYTIANIYGSRTGAASIWVKQAVWGTLVDEGLVKEGDRVVIDVESYKRGMSWSIEVHDNVDPIIATLVEKTMEQGQHVEENRLKREAEKEAKAEAARERAERIGENRRNPFDPESLD